MLEAQGTELGRGFWAITADTTGLTNGLQAGREGVAETGSFFQRHSRVIGGAMITAGTAITGSMIMATRSYAKNALELGRLSDRTGFAVEELSKLERIMGDNDISMSNFETAVRRTQREIHDFIESGGDAEHQIAQLGISLDAIKAADPHEQFVMIAEAIAAVDNEAARTDAAFQVMGRSGTQLIPIMSDLGQTMDQMEAPMDDEDVRRAVEFDDAMDKLNNMFQDVAITIGQDLLPHITGLVEWLVSAVEFVTNLTGRIPGLTEALLGLGVALKVMGAAALASSFKFIKLAAAKAIAFAYTPVGWAIMAAGVTLGALAGVAWAAGAFDGGGDAPDTPDMTGDAGMGGPAAGAVPEPGHAMPDFLRGGSTVNIDARGAYIRDEADMDRMARDIGDYTAAQLAGAGA